MPFLDIASSASNEEPLPPLRLKREEPGPSKPAGPGPGARLQEVELIPQPCFVIKTLLQTPFTNPIRLHDYQEGTKFFINVTFADQVPEQADERSLVPCLVSDARECEDKSGKPALVIDATIPPLAAAKCKKDKPYKQWMIQVVLERVEEKINAELSRDYAEPNLKSKGPLTPRRAVVPVNPNATPSVTASTSKIQVMDEVISPTYTSNGASNGSANPTNGVSSVKGSATVDKGKGKMTPRHEFDLKEKGSRFVFSLFLPEETPSSIADVKLSLAPDHLDFESERYKISVDLPMDVDVPSVLSEGTEWSIADKAIRLKGKVAGR